MSKHSFYCKILTGLLVVMVGLVGCHQDPVVPNSLIPFTCQIGLVDAYDGPARTVYTYQYDAFGNQTGIKDSSNTGSLNVRTYKFDSDKYLVSQQFNATTFSYTYSGTPKQISRVAGGDYTYEYTYEGDKLKTYVEKNSKNGTTDTYTFTNGILSGISLSNGSQVEVVLGKVKSFTVSGLVTNYTYDNEGQLTQIESVTLATGNKTINQYTYDTKKFYYNASIRARGFPILTQEGQPGYDESLGYGVLVHNYQTVRRYSYKNNVVTASDTLVYRHQYNADGYSTGYLRSDGARTKYYYTNCPDK